MLKKVAIFFTVMIIGLLTGYFSGPIYNFLWPHGQTASKFSPKSTQASTAVDLQEAAPKYLSGEEAVNAAKNYSPIKEAARASESAGSKVTFMAEQEPTDESPVWIVEMKEQHPDKVPVTRFIQIDAVSGQILDLQSADLKISNLGFTSSRQEVSRVLGKPVKSKKIYDSVSKQSLRVDTYKGAEVVYNSRGQVTKITSSRAEMPGPKGVKPGDTKTDVIKLFGRASTVLTDLLEYRPVDDKNLWMVIKFDSENRVAEISLEKAH